MFLKAHEGMRPRGRRIEHYETLVHLVTLEPARKPLRAVEIEVVGCEALGALRVDIGSLRKRHEKQRRESEDV
jgi:hypothetical protein